MKKLILGSLVVGLFIFGMVKWDIYRWHTFQEVTKSDVGYWKWKLVIDDDNSGVSVGHKHRH